MKASSLLLVVNVIVVIQHRRCTLYNRANITCQNYRKKHTHTHSYRSINVKNIIESKCEVSHFDKWRVNCVQRTNILIGNNRIDRIDFMWQVPKCLNNENAMYNSIFPSFCTISLHERLLRFSTSFCSCSSSSSSSTFSSFSSSEHDLIHFDCILQMLSNLIMIIE